MNSAQHDQMEREQKSAVLLHANVCLACKSAPGIAVDDFIGNCHVASQIARDIYWDHQKATARDPAHPDV